MRTSSEFDRSKNENSEVLDEARAHILQNGYAKGRILGRRGMRRQILKIKSPKNVLL